jgi:phytanoyl-CoA hydroxylase
MLNCNNPIKICLEAEMLTESEIAQFQRDGFLNYGRVLLTDDELTGLRASLDRVMRGESEGKPDGNRNLLGADSKLVVTQIVNIWEAEPDFARHLYNDRIVPLVSQLMGADTVRVWHDQIQIKPPFIGGPTTWHQDFPYWHVIQPSELVSAWVALEDADVENGCMSMVRGSHKWGPYRGPKGGGTIGNTSDNGPDYEPALVPPGETVEVVPVPVRAGSVVFHHCLTWHGAPPNASARSRPAIAVHYMPGHTRYEKETGAAHMVEEHITVAPGEILRGEHFPTVLEKGTLHHFGKDLN